MPSESEIKQWILDFPGVGMFTGRGYCQHSVIGSHCPVLLHTHRFATETYGSCTSNSVTLYVLMKQRHWTVTVRYTRLLLVVIGSLWSDCAPCSERKGLSKGTWCVLDLMQHTTNICGRIRFVSPFAMVSCTVWGKKESIHSGLPCCTSSICTTVTN